MNAPGYFPDQNPLPTMGMILGIDYGTKRVGVAVSDREQRYSSPLYNHQRQGLQGDARFFKKVVAEFRPVGFVVGLPLHMNGSESQKSSEARQFADWLSQITGLPHTFQDERLTSYQAESLLMTTDFTKKQRKERMDKLAAQILLQAWLDRHGKPSEFPTLPTADARGESVQDDPSTAGPAN